MLVDEFVEIDSTVGYTRQLFEVRTSCGKVEKKRREYKKLEEECEAGIAQLK